MPGRLQQVRKTQKNHLCGQKEIKVGKEKKKQVVQVGAVKSVSRRAK
jgi:hypothetical protein